MKRAGDRSRAGKSQIDNSKTDRSQIDKSQIDKSQIDKSQVQVIARAVSILRALEGQSSGLSLGQIAQEVNLARSTVQRIVAALAAEKLLIAASPTGRVRLGPTILRLAASVTTDFVSVARPFLVSLSNELRETVDLAAVKRDRLIFIDQVIGSQRLRTVSGVGETFPLYCTANGKAHLARLDDDAIEQLIGRSYEKRTPNSVGSLAELLRDLKSVRKTGVAFDREEHTLGICAVGVALQDPLGNSVAISVPVPAPRFYDRQDFIAKRLLATLRSLEDHFTAAAA
ncbi:MAG: IclR family transcriptional regulator [Xanthobacteraceae bacterium]|jgi:DNA-binding IclR family transcriptional regulator